MLKGVANVSDSPTANTSPERWQAHSHSNLFDGEKFSRVRNRGGSKVNARSEDEGLKGALSYLQIRISEYLMTMAELDSRGFHRIVQVMAMKSYPTSGVHRVKRDLEKAT